MVQEGMICAYLPIYIKRKYQKDGIRVLRAIQDNSLVRLTVPNDTPRLKDEVKRQPAYMMLGGESKTRSWVWVWSGSPEWEDNLERVKA